MDSSSSGPGHTPRTCSKCSRTAGKGKDALACRWCDQVICKACNGKGRGGGKGDTVLQCERCDRCICDRCEHKERGERMFRCDPCDKLICEGCDSVLRCQRCDYSACDSCLGKGKSKGIFKCSRCNKVMCKDCNAKGGDAVLQCCLRCDLCICTRCKFKVRGKRMFSCDRCDQQICEGCGSVLQCDRCEYSACDSCFGKREGKGILACSRCDKVICDACSGKGGGGGMGDTILKCAKCNLISCDRCASITRCNRIGVDLCESCQGWNIFADYQASCKELDSIKAQLISAEDLTSQNKQNLATAQMEKYWYEREIDQLRANAEGDKNGLKELFAQLAERSSSSLQPLLQVCPTSAELTGFITDVLPKLKPGMSAVVPVQALRWTHAGINAQLAFGDDHEHAEESIFKLFEQLFRGRLSSLELTQEDPLPVYMYRGPDKHMGLYSRRNRRLATLLMYQGLVREEVVKVHVTIRSPQDPKWRKDWQRSYDNSTGLSIQPHEGRRARACHRGRPLFQGSHAIVADVLNQAIQRPHSTRTQQALDLVAHRLRPRPSSKAEDEMSATFAGSVA